jgi:hypothetical protein
MSLQQLLKRVLERIPEKGAGVTDWVFKHWSAPGRVTDESVGILPLPGVDATKFLGRVMDVNGYTGPIPHVVESRAVSDPRFQPPEKVRFYQRLKIPLIGEMHQESVLEMLGERGGYQVAGWSLLDKETEALNPKVAIRGQYSDGAWMVGPGVVAYALSSAPRRDDVGFLKWKALTTGADVAAAKVVKGNIQAMAEWARRA